MTPVLWLHHARPRPHWYDLADAEREHLLEQWRTLDAASVTAGGEPLGDYRVRGQSDWSTVSAWRFPDVDAAYAHWQGRVRAGYSTWFAFANSLGTQDGLGAVPEAGA